MDYDLDAANIAAAQDQTMQHRMLGGGYTNMDNEYDQGYGMEPGSMMSQNMPDQVANFLREFQYWIHRDVYVQNNQGGYEPDASVRQEKLNEIQTCYEYKFSKFSEGFYKDESWPHADAVSQLVEGDEVFLMLYKELYFRHLYSKLGPNITLEQRMESWENYTSLFDRIFSDDDDDNNLDRLDLPLPWLWDMVDEFVYQFTDFCRFRTKDLKKRSAAEVEAMAQNPKVWDSMQVMATLNRMVALSEINTILSDDKKEPEANKLHTALGSEIGIAHVQLVLGYYALVSMCRMHCSCGDYWTALKCIENLDFKGSNSDQVPVYMRVTSCYIALYYYMGFSLMMMRRYTDSVRTMTGVLMYLYRTQHLTRPYQYEQLNKRSEQMYKLIAMCINLCPQRNVEDIVMQHLQDKYSDQLGRLGRGEEAMFEELFSYAGPKFFYPGHPNYADASNPVNARDISLTLNQQWTVFKGDMQQQQKLPVIRSYLKLYTTISTAKLGSFAEMPEERLRAQILALKHKSTGRLKTTKAGTAPLDGEIMSSSIVDFYLEKELVHIADSRLQPTFVHYFTNHISKLESLVSDLKVRVG